MDTTDMIDLGREYDSPCMSEPASDKKGEKKTSYPELYISGTEEMPDLPKGDFYILAKVCVSRLSIDAKNEENSSVSLEVKGMKVVGEAESEDEEMDVEVEMDGEARLRKALGDEDYED